MDVLDLDHYTIRTNKLDESRDFYVDVVGLSVGDRPPFKFPGYWLYAHEQPLVHLFMDDDAGHLGDYMGAKDTGGSGPIDHIALRCKGLADFRKKFAGLSLEMRERTVPEQGFHQIFVQDPNGVTIELIFAATELSQT